MTCLNGAIIGWWEKGTGRPSNEEAIFPQFELIQECMLCSWGWLSRRNCSSKEAWLPRQMLKTLTIICVGKPQNFSWSRHQSLSLRKNLVIPCSNCFILEKLLHEINRQLCGDGETKSLPLNQRTVQRWRENPKGDPDRFWEDPKTGRESYSFWENWGLHRHFQRGNRKCQPGKRSMFADFVMPNLIVLLFIGNQGGLTQHFLFKLSICQKVS